MKVYSIGRELGCDIVINDSTDVISRRHATLNVASSGKMTIVDTSHNGTYVNGIRISSNVPVPVTRKDNISFAHVARLDWNQVPNPRASLVRYGLIALLAIILVVGGVLLFNALQDSGTPKPETPQSPVAVDSIDLKREKEKMLKKEKQLQDSIKQHVTDSLNKVHNKNTVPAKAKSTPRLAAPTSDGTKKQDTPKAEPKKEEPKRRMRG
ncbi:MAG: FHA domain-containing protein [Bacteroidaceae bacterium]|nr:FHA domain-containing protein [Bacteroidaceae bacterium]